MNILDEVGSVFLNITDKIRPSHSRISQLEEENEQLRMSLAMLQSQNDHDTQGQGHLMGNASEQPSPDNSLGQMRNLETTEETGLSSQVPTLARSRFEDVQAAGSMSDNQQPSNGTSTMEPRIVVLAEGEPRYHGPTSALFEDSSGDRRARHTVPNAHRLPPAWVQMSLMAEAASQRMLKRDSPVYSLAEI